MQFLYLRTRVLCHFATWEVWHRKKSTFRNASPDATTRTHVLYSLERVVEILNTPDVERVSNKPAAKPTADEVHVFTYGSDHTNWL